MTEALILALCLNVQTSLEYNKYYESCVYSMRAASIQYQIRPKIDSIQTSIEEVIERRTNATIRGTMGVLYGFFQKGAILINSDFRPISDTVTFQTVGSTANITFTWTF